MFASPVPAETLHRFGMWLTRNSAEHGVAAVEVFPKNAGDTSWGHALRLPGRHPRRGVWPRVWIGVDWVSGQAAIGHVLSLEGDDPGLIPADAAFFGVEPATGAVGSDGAAGQGAARTGPWAAYNRTARRFDEVAAAPGARGWTRGRQRADGAVGFVRPGKAANEGEGGNLLVVDGVPLFFCFTESRAATQARAVRPPRRCWRCSITVGISLPATARWRPRGTGARVIRPAGAGTRSR